MLNAFMNWEPANVDSTSSFRNSLRNWTGVASSDPYAAEAMIHGRMAPRGITVVIVVVVDVTVAVGEYVVLVTWTVEVVVVVVPV